MPDATVPVAVVRLRCATTEATRAVARAVGAELGSGDVVVLDGPLGAGKTTFVQGLALGLGITAPVTSPTFVLARHQRPDPSGPRPGGPDLVHVDAYRLAGALELDDLDLDSDLDRAVVVVEWGQGLAERLSPARLQVRLDRETGPGTADDSADDGGDAPRTLALEVVGHDADRADRLTTAAATAAATAAVPEAAPC